MHANDYVELVGKIVVLITVLIGAREGKRAVVKGQANKEHLTKIEASVNGQAETVAEVVKELPQ